MVHFLHIKKIFVGIEHTFQNMVHFVTTLEFWEHIIFLKDFLRPTIDIMN